MEGWRSCSRPSLRMAPSTTRRRTPRHRPQPRHPRRRPPSRRRQRRIRRPRRRRRAHRRRAPRCPAPRRRPPRRRAPRPRRRRRPPAAQSRRAPPRRRRLHLRRVRRAPPPQRPPRAPRSPLPFPPAWPTTRLGMQATADVTLMHPPSRTMPVVASMVRGTTLRSMSALSAGTAWRSLFSPSTSAASIASSSGQTRRCMESSRTVSSMASSTRCPAAWRQSTSLSGPRVARCRCTRRSRRRRGCP
mmetsp:Transcript_35680/g.114197  ORF Transcript_35680/g.114197 Transcript_35680/m.114197 type:complete len:245 (-) Transcript_35680:627-1361(-)